MGRRPKHSKEEFRAIALNAAQDIIATDGLQGLNVRSLAARMGVSVGTIYNFFSGLEELVALVNGETIDGLYAALSEVPLTGRPDADLHALLDRYLAYIGARRSNWNLLFEERLPDAAAPPPWYLAKIARLFDLLARVLEPLFGPNRRDARDRAVRLLWTGLHGIWTLDARDHLFIVTDESLDSVAHGMVDAFLSGLSAPAPR